MKTKNTQSAVALGAAVAAVINLILSPGVTQAGTSQNTSTTTLQGPLDAITISFSGQTALRLFNNSKGISTLQPGTSITYHFGPTGSTFVTYSATNTGATYVQLAKNNFTTSDVYSPFNPDPSFPLDVQQHSGLRVEWHEQGSVQSQFDLLNDQIGYVSADGGATGYISNLASRGPSTANPTWINNNSFTAGSTITGHALSNSNFANTYDTAVYNRVTGRNLQNGQDRIQFSVGEFKTESLSKAGTASHTALPGAAGYGVGNPALQTASNTIGLGFAGKRQQLFNESFANESTDKVDPNSTTDAHYAVGPWNTAGVNNIDSKQISVTTVAYAANPGTGLYHINRGDGQWLLTTGRLQNGADFNVVNRANDAGQRLIPAISVGVDPSWSVGENDDGNTSGTAATNAQTNLGAGIRFSGKTSGTVARNVIAQSRLGFGPLSITETRGAASAAPVRALDVDFEHLTDTGNPSDFVRANFDNTVNYTNVGTVANPIYHPTYRGVLISHYNTIKAPRPDLLAAFKSANPGATPLQIQDWWNGLSSADTGIKGDPYGNVAAFINNITNSTGTAAVGLTPNSANNPADALFGAGFLIPGLLNYSREYTGGPVTPVSLSGAQQLKQADLNTNYGTLFSADGTAGSNVQTIGSSATYGALNASGAPAINGVIPITAKDAAGAPVPNGTIAPKGNYLFGNFNQEGRRDFAAVKESVNAALSLHHADGAKSSIYTPDGGVSNGTAIASLGGAPGWATTANTKGDLIVLGDFNSDGAFDGKDVYLLARGASLSDNGSTNHLTAASGGSFADQLRNPNAKLNKNAALDYAQGQTAAVGGDPGLVNADRAFLRSTARSVLSTRPGFAAPGGATVLSTTGSGPTLVTTYTLDPSGSNAFNNYDVNRDGSVNKEDAKIVEYFIGKSYTSLDDQLGAVVRIDANDGGTAFVADVFTPLDPTAPANSAIPRRLISLVDVELTDAGATLFSSADGLTRLRNILRDDFDSLAGYLETHTSTGTLTGDPSQAGLTPGDVNLDGQTDGADISRILSNIGGLADDALLSTWSSGDLNSDGQIDGADLVTGLSDIGSLSGYLVADHLFSELHLASYGVASDPVTQSFSVVPEPGTFGLAIGGGLGLLARRRRRRSV